MFFARYFFPIKLPSGFCRESLNVAKFFVRGHAITLDNINPNIKNLQYAVRGPIVVRAGEIVEELKAGVSKDFSKVTYCNIGDCHACGQVPITFFRKLCALVVDTNLFNDPTISDDIKQRARTVLDNTGGGSVGSYSDSCGLPSIRQNVAKYIEERDGVSSDYRDIFLSSGASSAIRSILQLISTTKTGTERAGIMIPIPQYPIYSATNAEFNAYQIDYYLDEQHSWGFAEQELEHVINEAKPNCIPRAICVINPGNPTGQVLHLDDIKTVIRFARRHGLLILADEVYQQNVYSVDKPFHSFKKVLHSMGDYYANEVQLASFMSASKGYMGECGFRSGYCELVNFHSDVKAQLFKYLSSKLCSSVVGQTMMEGVVNPPKPGEPSFPRFMEQQEQVLNDLRCKAKMVNETFNDMEGFSCNVVEGAMYAFPRIDLPHKAIEKAESLNQSPDFFYCLELLEKTGICVVPGSGFGQKPGTFHFRITILPTVDVMHEVMNGIKKFHHFFMKMYG